MSTRSAFSNIRGLSTGQGVLVISPRYLVSAMRRDDGLICIKSLPRPFLNLPFAFKDTPWLRGLFYYLEMSFFLIEFKSESEQKSPYGFLFLSLFLIFALFAVIPQIVMELLGGSLTGIVAVAVLRLIFLFLMIWFFSLNTRVQEFWRYQGAVHQALHTFEAGEDLNIDHAKRHPLSHPRSFFEFLLQLAVLSVLVLSFWSVFKLVALIFVVGMSYEITRLLQTSIFQSILLRRPEDQELEVALCALRQALRLEKGIAHDTESKEQKDEFFIKNMSDLGRVYVAPDEFLESKIKG